METLNTPGVMVWIPVSIYMCQHCVDGILWGTQMYVAHKGHQKGGLRQGLSSNSLQFLEHLLALILHHLKVTHVADKSTPIWVQGFCKSVCGCARILIL